MLGLLLTFPTLGLRWIRNCIERGDLLLAVKGGQMKRHQSGRHFQRLLCAWPCVVAGGCPHLEELAGGDGTVTA